MKIKSLEYENFRNYKKHNKIEFSTNGKVDIIYGANGAGKTTFQQLIKWIVYGRIRFNKTTNDYLYNLETAHQAAINDKFNVLGIIDFEHKGINYSARREVVYEKTVFGIKEISNSFVVLEQDSNKNWNNVNDPVDLIERLLPSGLESYFFLEGENMIADLKVKGKESAGNLRDALYLMLDLAVYEKAIKIIGDTEARTSVLGTLLKEKTVTSSSSEVQTLGNKLETAQTSRDSLLAEKKRLTDDIKNKEEIILITSEQIGAAKSQEEYESKRNEAKKNKNYFIEACSDEYAHFGEMLADTLPKVVMSSIIAKASVNIKEAAENQFIHGINRDLIDSLLSRDVCICGNKLTEKERDIIRGYYKMLPPDGYEELYYDFVATAKQWGENFNEEKFVKCITSALNCLKRIEDAEDSIAKIDAEMKKYKGIDKLVVERKQAEVDKDKLVRDRERNISELNKFELLIKKLARNINEKSAQLNENASIEYKIQIMSTVKKYFEEFLAERSIVYSKKLEEAIQELVDAMLMAKRKVSVSSDFALQVVDNYDDESKSDGQLATISFAYIGGIFKVLKDNKLIQNTEYPLIMDAPFSKLNKESIERVVEIIPQYAPQMIILIKDDVLNYFNEDQLGKIFTIESNVEQNVAEIKEGKLWQ